MESSTPPTADRAAESAVTASSAGSTSSLPPAGSQPGASAAPVVPERSPSRSSLRQSTSSHRQSFAENLRNAPPSPRSLRQPSFTQQVQGLLNHPPPQRQPQARFAGRDWHDISLGELVSEEDVRWATMDTSVEDCTKVSLQFARETPLRWRRGGVFDKIGRAQTIKYILTGIDASSGHQHGRRCAHPRQRIGQNGNLDV